MLSLLLKEINFQSFESLDSYPKVALLYCTCNDANVDLIKKLSNQTYPNLDIFILDDSTDTKYQIKVDSLSFDIVRRNNRNGFKAGNINNWLFNYGANYKYFVIADADSFFLDNFIKKMVLYAEHPTNSEIAIFESLIHAWNTKSKFVNCQNIMSSLTDKIKLCVENNTGSTLSVGHNNLLRTNRILSNGGFDEYYLAEDYAISLDIIKNSKCHCKTMPITSYERLPENLTEYSRRQARWAFQTFQLNRYNISKHSISVRLKILRSLHYYASPIVAILGIVLMGFYISSYTNTIQFDWEVFQFLFNQKTIMFWICYLFLPITLRFLMLKHKGVSIIEFVESTLLHGALFVSTIWPVLVRLSTTLVKSKPIFEVTGVSAPPSFTEILKLGAPIFILFWFVLIIVLLNPAVAGFNLIWLIPSSLSPLIIYHFQKSDL